MKILFHGSGDKLPTLTLTEDVVGKLTAVLWLTPDARAAAQYAADDAEDGEGYVYRVALDPDVRLVDEGTHTDDVHQARVDAWRSQGYQGAWVVDYDSRERRHESVVLWDEDAVVDVEGLFPRALKQRLMPK